MINRKCIKPKKVVTIMKTFADNCGNSSYIIKKGDSFQVFIPDNDEELIFNLFLMNYNFNEFDELTPFRRCWVKEYPMIKGFATITLTLLHEVGHIETMYDVNYSNEQRDSDIKEILETEDYDKYFFLPDERAATEWAINWLSNSENRKIAKSFEKEFFKCFKRG